MLHHIKIAKKYGVPVVVAVNKFYTDTDAELALVRKAAVEQGGAFDAVVSEHWEFGGEGAVDLAKAVIAASEQPHEFKFLYPIEATIKEKIETIAKEIYNADGVDYTPEAEARIADYERLGFGNSTICMAKTHLSISHDAAWKGVPSGYRLPISDIRASVGAGFLYPLVGEMRTMPGLSTRPAYFDVDLDPDTGEVLGLF
jgi:formyltetrahydrofolate synthetase